MIEVRDRALAQVVQWDDMILYAEAAFLFEVNPPDLRGWFGGEISVLASIISHRR